MTPEAIVAAITAVAEAFAEGFKYAQTPAGQEAAMMAVKNQEAFQKGITDLGTWFEKLFTGKLT